MQPNGRFLKPISEQEKTIAAISQSSRDPRSLLLSAPIWPTLIKLAAPNMVGVIIQSTISIFEIWLLGGLGRAALAGVALVMPIAMLQAMLAGGAIGGAVSGATARAFGADRRDEAEAVLRIALLISIGASMLMATLLLSFGPAIYRFLGGHGETIEAALSYSNMLFAGVIAIWLYHMLASFLRGLGDTIRPAQTSVLITVIYVPAAWILIGGFGPIAGLGMSGAALAFVVAYLAGAVALLFHLQRGKAAISLRLRGPVPWSSASQILKSGLFAGSQSVLTIVTFLMITAAMGRLGTAALAGYGIGARIEILMIPFIFGFGGAMIAMVGANVGAGQHERAVAIAWRGILASAFLVGAVGLTLAFVPSLWAERFTDDPEVIGITQTYLQIVGPFYPFFAIGLAAYFASQGLRSLLFPVLGAWIRFVTIVIGFFALSLMNGFTPTSAFSIVAAAMLFYGCSIAIGLHLGPWRQQQPVQHHQG